MALSLLSSSCSFAPMLQPHTVAQRAGVALMAEKSAALPFVDKPAGLDGSMAGDVGFDPLGFSNHELGPFDTPAEHMAWMREAELKHGRVCMLGVVGWILVDWGFRAPGAEKIGSVTSFAAHDATVASGHLAALMLAVLVFEIAGAGAIKASLEGTRTPGDFALTGGFGKTPEALKKLQEQEIKHSRLAMMAFGGIATQTALGYTSFPYF